MRLLTLRLAFLVSTLYLVSCNSTKSDYTDSTTNKDTVLTVTQSKTIRQEQLPKSDSTFEKDSIGFSLDTFTAIPNEIDGCGCDFYLSKQDQKKEKYFFVNAFASIAFISINGKVEKFELTEHAENSNVYLYSNGTYHLKVEITKEKDSDYEYSDKEGLIIVSKGGKEIRKRFIGGCGC